MTLDVEFSEKHDKLQQVSNHQAVYIRMMPAREKNRVRATGTASSIET